MFCSHKLLVIQVVATKTIKNYWMRLRRLSELFKPRSALSAEAPKAENA